MGFIENLDKNKAQKIMLIVIAALVLAALVCLVVIIISSINPATPQKTDFDVIDATLTENDTLVGPLVLADAKHTYTVDRSLLDLVECQTYRNEQMAAAGSEVKEYLPYKGMMLNKTAMEAAHKMLSDAKKAVGGDAVTIDAAFDRVVYSGSESEEGFKTGLLMFLSDFTSDSGAYVALSDEYASWFKSNCAKYGFINSSDDAYRYVGKVHAKYITDSEITLAEYVEYLKKNTDPTKALTIKVDNTEYAVYYVEGEAGDTVKVPATESYTISGTNDGGVVVTVKLAK